MSANLGRLFVGLLLVWTGWCGADVAQFAVCGGRLKRISDPFPLAADFDNHLNFVNWTYGHDGRPRIVSGGHTVAAIENFAVLRPDLFPQGPAPFGQFFRNGTVVYRLPREAFVTEAWQRSAGRSRREDRLGIKSAFPIHWTTADVRAAVRSVSEHPEVILNGRDTLGFYLDGTYRGVGLRVHVIDGKILRAYPLLVEDTVQ